MDDATKFMESSNGVVTVAILAIISLALYIMIFILHIRVTDILQKLFGRTIKGIGKGIKKKEDKFSRDYEIGLITKKRLKYKSYQLLNDLTIDLGLKLQGVTPYEFLFIILTISLMLSLSFGILIFSSLALGVFAFPIVASGVLCAAYTKANIAHDARIEAVIEAENIISNNINEGVIVAVKQTIDSLPKEVRTEFKDFLNNIEDNTYIVTALLDLNNKLGTISDDFIQKCIKLMTDEEHGTSGIFQDVIELNNIKSQLRLTMKKSFEVVVTDFIVSTVMILVFLLGVIVIYPVVRTFYFTTLFGQLLILFDILILIGEFVYITLLRAQDF